MIATHTGNTPSRFPVSILRQELVYTAAETVTSIPSSAYTRSSFSNTCREKRKKKKTALIVETKNHSRTKPKTEIKFKFECSMMYVNKQQREKRSTTKLTNHPTATNNATLRSKPRT